MFKADIIYYWVWQIEDTGGVVQGKTTGGSAKRGKKWGKWWAKEVRGKKECELTFLFKNRRILTLDGSSNITN